MAPHRSEAYDFQQCDVRSVHRKWVGHDDVEVDLEQWRGSGQRNDQVHFWLNQDGAKTLCRGLLNIIGNAEGFFDDIEGLIRVLRIPEL